jgi:hypothetical protein
MHLDAGLDHDSFTLTGGFPVDVQGLKKKNTGAELVLANFRESRQATYLLAKGRRRQSIGAETREAARLRSTVYNRRKQITTHCGTWLLPLECTQCLDRTAAPPV